ncbi:hypothetical protein [Kibdelosporangium aridum]|uniref:hypothetical protein n=1 Tax=Kibdelosporangium aridum TaxID=2030 RepID=UPI001F221F5E|nr:hypothetical protein [Kibdelosporangium aridum]
MWNAAVRGSCIRLVGRFISVALHVMKQAEWLVQFVLRDLVLIDVELLEDGLVQQTPLLVVASPVQLLGVLEQLERQFNQAGGDGELLVGVLEANLQALTLSLDIAKLLFDLGLRDRLVAIGHQVDQVGFLDVEGMYLSRELSVEEPGCCLLIFERLGDVAANVGDEAGGKSDGGVVRLDGVLDMDDIDVRARTRAVLLVTAEEVGVLGAARVDGVLNDHA